MRILDELKAAFGSIAEARQAEHSLSGQYSHSIMLLAQPNALLADG